MNILNSRTTLFNVFQFHKTFQELLNITPNIELLNIPSDISVDDVKILTKFEQVEQQIQAALNGNEQDLENNILIKQSKELEKNAQENLMSVKENDDFPKNKRKEVNYITSFPQELGIERSWNGEIIENPEDEVVLSVAIYHPHKHTKMQEFTVLGSQPLTALRDSFYCINDHIGDGSITKSAFFFIENTFYNDMRFPECIDYSQPIIEWVNQNGRYTEPGLGIFASKSMAENTFNDLSIRIGAQYLYCHQGNCEHIIIFTDMRLFHNEDPKNKNLYPIHTFQSRIKRKKCRICDIYSAKFVTYGDRLSPENPCFYCDQCYRLLHYSVDGKLLFEDFVVFPYYHE